MVRRIAHPQHDVMAYDAAAGCRHFQLCALNGVRASASVCVCTVDFSRIARALRLKCAVHHFVAQPERDDVIVLCKCVLRKFCHSRICVFEFEVYSNGKHV